MKGDYSDCAIKVQDNGRWYILHDVIGDGNCFYRALCRDDFFHGYGYHHATLREQLCLHIREAARNNSVQMDVLQALLESSHGPRDGSTVVQYCEKMAEDKYYAGVFEACAMMLFFPVRILIVTAAKTDNSAMGGTTDCYKVWNHMEEILSFEPRLQGYQSYFLKPDPLCEIYILNHIHKRPFVIEPYHNVNHFLWLEPCELSDMRQRSIRAIEKPFELLSPSHGTCGKNHSSTQRTLRSSRKIQHSSERNKNGEDKGNRTRLRKTPSSRKKRKSQAEQSVPCHAQSASKATEMISRKRRHITSPSKQSNSLHRRLPERSKTELVDRCFEQYLSKGMTVLEFLASSDSYPLTENDLEVFLKWHGTPVDPIKQVEVQLVQFIKDNHIAIRGGKKLSIASLSDQARQYWENVDISSRLIRHGSRAGTLRKFSAGTRWVYKVLKSHGLDRYLNAAKAHTEEREAKNDVMANNGTTSTAAYAMSSSQQESMPKMSFDNVTDTADTHDSTSLSSLTVPITDIFESSLISSDDNLEPPVFLFCDNCMRCSYEDDDEDDDKDDEDNICMENHDTGHGNDIEGDGSTMSSSSDSDISLVVGWRDKVYCPAVGKEDTCSHNGLSVRLPRYNLHVEQICKRPSFAWNRAFCYLQKPKKAENSAPWDESMWLCQTCRIYITCRLSDEDIFLPEGQRHSKSTSNSRKKHWEHGNDKYNSWKVQNKKEIEATGERKFSWPAYMWLLFCDDTMLRLGGRELWKMLPLSLRCHWYESLIRKKSWAYHPVARRNINLQKKYQVERRKLFEMAIISHVMDSLDPEMRNKSTPENADIEQNITDCSAFVDGGAVKVFDVVSEHYRGVVSNARTKLESELCSYPRDFTKEQMLRNIPPPAIAQLHQDESVYSCTQSPCPHCDKEYSVEMHVLQNDPYQGCSYECPEPYFREGSDLYLDSMCSRNKNDSHSLLHFLHRYSPLCNVLCPYGCTEYIFNIGTVNFESVLIRYLNPFIYSSKIHLNRHGSYDKCLRGARDDFLYRDGHWLPFALNDKFLNSEQGITRFFLITADGPVIATCKRHHGGSSTYYIHPPVNPISSTLSSSISPQYAPCVLRPNVVKSMRRNKYSTTYEVRLLSGCYKGINSTDVCNHGDFSLSDPVHDANMLLAFQHRRDLQLLFGQLVKRGLMHTSFAQSCLSASEQLFSTEGDERKDVSMDILQVHNLLSSSREHALLGATFISFQDSITLEYIMSRSHRVKSFDLIDIPLDDNGSNSTRHGQDQAELTNTNEFIPPWPPSYIFIHPVNRHGAVPHTAISSSISDTKLESFLHCVANIPEVYHSMFVATKSEKLFHGWVLKYVHEHFFPEFKQTKVTSKAPYKPWSRLCEYLNTKDVESSLQLLLCPGNTNGSTRPPHHSGASTAHNSEGAGDFFSRVLTCSTGKKDQIVSVRLTSDIGNIITVPNECEMIVLYRCVHDTNCVHHMKGGSTKCSQFVDHSLLSSISSTTKKTFKARFITTKSPVTLKSHCYIRHREEEFTDWWCIESSSNNVGKKPFHARFRLFDDDCGGLHGTDDCSTLEDNISADSAGFLPPDVLNYWNAIVYVRSTCDRKKLHDELFRGMGGNLNVVCSHHKMPLIECRKSTEQVCSFDASCERKSRFECVWGCDASICQKHIKEQLSSSSNESIIEVHPPNSNSHNSSHEVPTSNTFENLPFSDELFVGSAFDSNTDFQVHKLAATATATAPAISTCTTTSTDTYGEDDEVSETQLSQDQLSRVRYSRACLDDRFCRLDDLSSDRCCRSDDLSVDDMTSATNDSASDSQSSKTSSLIQFRDVMDRFRYCQPCLPDLADDSRMSRTMHKFAIPDHVDYEDIFRTDAFQSVPKGAWYEEPGDKRLVHDYGILDPDLLNCLRIPTVDSYIHRASQIHRGGRKYMGAHTYINFKGQCLLRQNNDLSLGQHERSVMQDIISTTGDPCSLAFPEAMLFPDIFWYGNSDGSVVGSLTGTLWTDKARAAQVNIAGYHDHLICRISNPHLSIAANPRYIFLGFDVLSNIQLRGTTDNTVLNRGIRERNHGLKVLNQGNTINNVRSCDVIDSRHSVSCLSCMLRAQFPGYFVTVTCNSREFPGMHKLHNLKAAFHSTIDDDITLSQDLKHELKQGLERMAAVQSTRTWQVCIEMVIQYLTKSNDQILGKFDMYFARLENQENELKASGTNSHLHLIAWTDHDPESKSEMDEHYRRVRCSSNTFYFADDVSKLIEMGIITDGAEAEELRKKTRIIQRHDCKMCGFRCMRKRPDGTKHCRYVDYFLENPKPDEYGFILIHMTHSDEATAILCKLDFMTRDKNGTVTIKDERFRAGKHVYPAERGERFTPTNPTLFSLVKSDCNVIVCGRYMVSRYLANYVGSVDAVARVDYRARPGTKGDLEITIEPLNNTKIKSSKIAEKNEMSKKKHFSKPHGRIIGLPEAIAQIFQFNTVFCSSKFVQVSTVSLEQRPAVIKQRSTDTTKKTAAQRQRDAHAPVEPIAGGNNTNILPPSIASRESLPSWRKFTKYQQLQIKDTFRLNISIDSVTLYSVRPPELFFVGNYVDYLRYFAFVPSCGAKVQMDVSLSAWLDGYEKRVVIRRPAVKEIIERYSEKMLTFHSLPMNDPHRIDVFTLFHALLYVENKSCFSRHHMDILASLAKFGCDTIATRKKIQSLATDLDPSIFIDQSYNEDHVPLAIYSNIKPCNGSKFFIHILLSMGSFNTEYELWNVSEVPKSFVVAGLMSDSAYQDKELAKAQLKDVAHRYVSEQLLYVPAGTRSFDFFLREAWKVLYSIYIDGHLPPYPIPTALHSVLEKQMCDKIATEKNEMKVKMIDAIHKMIPNLPSKDDFLLASTSKPMPSSRIGYTALLEQSKESIAEQSQAFKTITDTIDKYACSQVSDNNNWILHGSPGTGKTHLSMLLLAYALGQGLSVLSTALVADRADYLGGIHYHSLLKMTQSGANNDMSQIHSIADTCIQKIQRYHPTHLHFLRSIDVLFFDEIGQMSAQAINILDVVLRWARRTDAYLGGIILIAAMDMEQLGTIGGVPFLASANIITSYQIIDFEHYVRCGGDIIAQRVCEVCRMSQISPSAEKQFIKDIVNTCNFVSSINDVRVPRDALRVLGKKKGLEMAEKQFVEALKLDGVQVIEAKSIDAEKTRTSSTQFVEADKRTVNALNKSNMVREPQTLYLYKKCVMEFTHNKTDSFNQGQLAICMDPPTQTYLRNDTDPQVTVWKAPPGIKVVPSEEVITNDISLKSAGWNKISVTRKKAQNVITIGNGVVARRSQFPLRSRIVSTCHRTMGSNLSSLVTEISTAKEAEGYLWDRGQIVVLLSRTPELKRIYFVMRPGKKREDIARDLLTILRRRPQYYEYMRHIITARGMRFCPRKERLDPFDKNYNISVCNLVPRVISLKSHPYRPMDIPLPDDGTSVHGYTYFLLSLKDPCHFYIGSCLNIVDRYNQHNHDIVNVKHKIAPVHLRPWALIGFITGFNTPGNNQTTERNWQFQAQRLVREHPYTPIKDIVQIGKNIAHRSSSLVYQECSKMHYLEELQSS